MASIVEPGAETLSLQAELLRLPQGESSGAESAGGGAWDWALCAAIVCGYALLLYASAHFAVYRPVLAELEHHKWARLLARPSLVWVTMGTLLLGFRTVLWFRYQPFAAAAMDEAPALTVVIPAYNEGPMVLQSIESVAAASYPRERLQVIVVDDGSTDDTWEHISRAAARHPGLVTAIRFPRNRGKRAALAEGFRQGRGAVLATLDSDSVVERHALLALVGPFRNARVGAVAGKVAVYNRREGLIPRMLHVRYVISFDLLRAVESSYGTVYCCPGALTAYRASLVRGALDEWLGQTFLGSRCTFGEDRAMTNLILARGYDTVYQRTAVVRTLVPLTYGKLCKMFLRWDRSYVREEIRFLRIVWKRPLASRFIALYDRIITNLRYPVQLAVLLLLGALAWMHPLMLLRILVAIGLMSFFNMLYYLRSERSPDFLYGVVFSYYSAFAMFWIFPYAVLTVRARGWLTR